MLNQWKKARGFTLIEVMIVVAIVAILLAIGLPGYQEQVRKTKRALARGELLEVLARQEQYFVNNKAYATNLQTGLGYPATPTYYIDTDGNDLGSPSGAIYSITISGATATSYTLTAVPQAGDPRCGDLTITSAGAKAASTGSTSNCW